MCSSCLGLQLEAREGFLDANQLFLAQLVFLNPDGLSAPVPLPHSSLVASTCYFSAFSHSWSYHKQPPWWCLVFVDTWGRSFYMVASYSWLPGSSVDDITGRETSSLSRVEGIRWGAGGGGGKAKSSHICFWLWGLKIEIRAINLADVFNPNFFPHFSFLKINALLKIGPIAA